VNEKGADPQVPEKNDPIPPGRDSDTKYADGVAEQANYRWYVSYLCAVIKIVWSYICSFTTYLSHRQRLMVLFTFVLTATTSLYTFFSYHQWQTMERQLEYSERPWVGLASATISGPPKDSVIKATLVFRNFGKSPASRVSVREIAFSPLNDPEIDRKFEDCRESPTDAGVGILLLPGQETFDERYSSRLNPTTIAYIERGLSSVPDQPVSPKLPQLQGVALVGCIDYWWNNRCYRTRFHRQYVRSITPEHRYGFLGASNFGNDTDWADCSEHKQ
jgi:hypothetical protein